MGFPDLLQHLLEFGKIYLIILKLYLLLHFLNRLLPNYYYYYHHFFGCELNVRILRSMQLIDVNNIVYLCEFVNLLTYYY